MKMTFLCFNVEMIFVGSLNLLPALVRTYVGYLHFSFSLFLSVLFSSTVSEN